MTTDPLRWISQAQIDQWTAHTGYKPPRHMEGGCYSFRIRRDALRQATAEEMITHRACQHCARILAKQARRS
jgi:hypothetical protein